MRNLSRVPNVGTTIAETGADISFAAIGYLNIDR
jgi:hypothetical protein